MKYHINKGQLQIILLIIGFCITAAGYSQTKYPTPVEGDYIIKDFSFVDGEKISSLKLHYSVIGQPQTNKDGKVINAVLIMHGTTGSGSNFLTDRFAGFLFGPGQLLD